MAFGNSVPWPRIESGPWQWKPGILTTRPPENSLRPGIIVFVIFKSLLQIHNEVFRGDLISETCFEVKLLSRVRFFATSWTVAYQAPPSMGFSRQEYWSGLPFPSPGDLPNSGIKPGSPALQADALTSEPPGKHNTCFKVYEKWPIIIEKDDQYHQSLEKCITGRHLNLCATREAQIKTTVSYYFILIKMTTILKRKISVGDVVEKLEPLCTVDMHVKQCNHYEKQYRVSFKN